MRGPKLRFRLPERITEQIFLGNGDYSMELVKHLHAKLDEAVDILSGMQQPPMSTDPEGTHARHLEEIEEGKAKLDDIAKEIFVALTGHEVDGSDPEPDNYPEMPEGWVQGVDAEKKTQWTKKGCKWGVIRRGEEEFVLTFLPHRRRCIQSLYVRGGKEAILPTPAIAAGIADTLDFKFQEASYVGKEASGAIPCVLCTDMGLGLRDDQKAFLVEKAEGNYVTYLSPYYGIKAGDELLLPIVIMQYPINNDPVLIEIPTSEKDGPTREYVPSSSIRWVKTDG